MRLRLVEGERCLASTAIEAWSPIRWRKRVRTWSRRPMRQSKAMWPARASKSVMESYVRHCAAHVARHFQRSTSTGRRGQLRLDMSSPLPNRTSLP